MSDPFLLEKCCVVGEAVGGDPTHFMLQRAIDRLGLDWRMMSFQVKGSRLAEAIAGVDALGFRGVRLLDASRDRLADPASTFDLTRRAGRTGRVTHLTRCGDRLRADDATGPALVEALSAIGSADGRRVALLGAGGAASSVADALLERGAASLAIADFSADAARELAGRVRRQVEEGLFDAAPPAEVTALRWEAGWLELPEGCDLVVSVASWPKAENDRVAESLAPELSDRQVVVDLAVGSNRSRLLLAAEERGAAILDGLPLLVAETALALESWIDGPVDRATLRDAAEEFLGV